MSMNIGIISAEGYIYPPTQRLSQAAAEKGHRIVVIDPSRVWPLLKGGRPGWTGQDDIDDLDVVLPRQGATVLDSSLTLIPQISLMGIPMVNGLDAIRLTKDQFLTLQALSAARIPIPDTVFVNSEEGFQAALNLLEEYPVVVKHVNSRVGEGVFLVKNQQEGRLLVREQLQPARGLLVQRFIPTERRKDIRVLVIGGRILGAMELRPREGDFRANFHLSNRSWPIRLPFEWAEISLKAAKAVGLEIAGVDLIVDRHAAVKVIEVNYSPGFTGLEAATGQDIAGQIIDYLVQTYGKRKPL